MLMLSVSKDYLTPEAVKLLVPCLSKSWKVCIQVLAPVTD
jgi:hypothetical protein